MGRGLTISFDIPIAIEPQVQQVAAAQHITASEAIVRLIKAGLQASQPRPTSSPDNILSIPGLAGQPMSDEEASVMDEVVENAMESRNIRWAGNLGA